MGIIQLRLRYGTRSWRPPRAWYLAGQDPARWLQEIATWRVDQAGVRLFPVPSSSSPRIPCGVLVAVADSLPLQVAPRCVAFGTITERLFVPVEAQLDPEVSEAELRELLSADYCYVWHPAVGLVAYEACEVLTIQDLLTIANPSPGRWDCARPGITLNRRLVSLTPDEPPSLEVILGDGRDDIGTQRKGLSELPPSPQEPQPGMLSAAWRYGKRSLAGFVRSLTARTSRRAAGKPRWLERLDQWANQQVAGFHAGLEAARNKQILRLLNLLETDPDRGLRFAFGGGGGEHRGTARPGDRLLEHDVDFDLHRLSGGEPADMWQVPANYHYQLTARYRELADRELRLGRHRRAAYIFAELLGDYTAAAGALVAGRYWREAAVLYGQRLQRPLEAARCLEQGGLWTEAIAHYEELEQHEQAGDLYQKLEQHDRADQQYRRAVDKHRAHGDRLAAARLLETKLDSLDEAIAELSAAWPAEPPALECVRQVFAIFARVGQHPSTQRWISQFRQQPLPARHRVGLIDLLADTATNYPEQSVRSAAADCTRVLVSEQLTQGAKAESKALLSAVRRLVPHDRLLARDCQRFAARRRPAQLRPESRPSPPLLRTLRLPGKSISWRAAAQCGDTIVVAGELDDHLVLCRSSWQETDRPLDVWRLEPRLSESPLILTPIPHVPQGTSFVLVHVVGGPVLTTEYQVPASHECPTALRAGAIRGMSSAALAAASAPNGVIWLVEERAGQLTLIALRASGELVSTRVLPSLADPLGFEPPETGESGAVIPLPLAAHSDRLYVGLGNQMLTFHRTQAMETVDFGRPIRSLLACDSPTNKCVAVSFAQGATIYGDDADSGCSRPLAQDLADPILGFSRRGQLLAATAGRCQIYQGEFPALQLQAEFNTTQVRPLAVLAAGRADQLAIVFESGEIAIYELPG